MAKTRSRKRSTTILRADSPESLLRMVPMLVGLEPENSVVLVLFRDDRTHGAMRIDLPPEDDVPALQRWATEVVGLLCKVQGCTGVVPVVYTPGTFAPSGRVPRVAVLRALNRRAEQAGLTVKGLYCVAADGWGSPGDSDLPRGGRELSRIEPLPVDSQDGRMRLDRLPELQDASDAARRAFGAAYDAWWDSVGGPLGADGGPLHGVELRRSGSAFRRSELPSAMQRIRFGAERRGVVELVERMLDPHDHDPDAPCPCRALLYCLAQRPGLPSLLLVQFGFGRAFGARMWAAAERGDVDSTALLTMSAAIDGRSPQRPDAVRLQAAIAALLEVESYLPQASRPPVDAMLAWLHWALGACTLAGTLAERALADDPRNELATVVLRLCARLPEWAFGDEQPERALLA